MFPVSWAGSGCLQGQGDEMEKYSKKGRSYVQWGTGTQKILL